MKNLLLSALILTLLSCNQNKPIPAASIQIESDLIIPADTTSKNFVGLYRSGNGLSTFQDCNTNEVYWLTDSTEKLSQAYADATQSFSYSGESIHLEIKGHFNNKKPAGIAADYEKELIVTDIKVARPKSFKTPCFNFEFIALGNEPFWSVEIIPNEQRIVLKDVGLNKVYVFPYQPANVGGGVHRYDTKTDKDKLTVIIRKEKCSDGMSDREYDYSAEVTLNGSRVLKGCGIKKMG